MEGIDSIFPEEKRHILANIRKEMKAVLSGEVTKMSTCWKGYRFIPGFEAETAKFAYEKYDYEPDSIFIITFPKTGTNWTLEIMTEIVYGHNPELKTLVKSIPHQITVLENCSAETLELVEYLPVGRKIFASHLAEELFNFEKVKKSNGKVIIVLRNPKDQAVSWFHFTRKNPMFDGVREEMGRGWDEFVSNYMRGKHPIITKKGEWYPDHILGWYKHKHDPNVLFVHYEDMQRDAKKEIRRMANFVDIELSSDRVEQIAESTTFAKMKAASDKKGALTGAVRAKVNVMRKGQVGEWKEVFTAAQSEMMDRLIEEKLGKTDIKFTYEM